MARSLILPIERFRASVYPLVYPAMKAMASGSIEVIKKLSRWGLIYRTWLMFLAESLSGLRPQLLQFLHFGIGRSILLYARALLKLLSPIYIFNLVYRFLCLKGCFLW